MPELREHHKQPTVNPFDAVKPHVGEYTAAEIATVSRRLEKQLGPEYISARVGPGGGKVHYLSADKCIGLANEVFGFNGWSSSIQTIQVDFVDENEHGKVNLGLSVTLRVTLRDGTYHEDIGYGHIENCKGKAAAFEKAKKEGTTDALKRALRNFGNVLGNCIYDKEYIAKVTKLKAGPTRWDPSNLHRHPDFAPIEKELKRGPPGQSLDMPHLKMEAPVDVGERVGYAGGLAEDEFGSDDFDAVDFAVSGGNHPDEIDVNGSRLSDDQAREMIRPDQKRSISKSRSRDAHKISGIGSPSQAPEPQTPDTDTRLQRPKPLPPLFPHSNDSTSNKATPYHIHDAALPKPLGEAPFQKPLESTKDEPPVGFFTARAAESIQAGATPAIKAPLFDPRLESPSIRKTAGVDHTKTKPVSRDLTEAAPVLPSVAPGAMLRGNIVDPQSDRGRRIGMPIGTASPLQSRGSYRPPQMKRTGDMGALKDVTAASINFLDKGDAKRQKVIREVGVEAQDSILKT